MKKYFIIAFIVLVGVAVSLFLIPGANELALMQFKDKRYEEARQNYEQKLAEGNWSVNVVGALVDLHLQFGAIDKAIEVMQQYVEKNPTNIKARQELGKLYQYAQRPDDYLRNLEEINKLQASDESLRTMAEMYGATQQYEKQAPALQLLMEHNISKEPHHYRQLVSLQASEKKYDDAVVTLREFREKFPNDFQFPEYELMVMLLLDAGKPEEAFTEARQWTRHIDNVPEKTHDNVQKIARLVNILHYRGTPELGWRLLELYDAQTAQFPELAAEKAYILVNQGKQRDAYDLLTQLYQQGKLPESLHRDYMFLALQNGQVEVAQEMLEKLDIETLNEEQAISMLEMTTYDTGSSLRSNILKKMESYPVSEDKPVLAAMIAVANKKPEATQKIDALSNVELPTQKVLMVAGICDAYHQQYCVEQMLPRLQGKELNKSDSIRAANLYLSIGKLEEARNLTNPLYEAHAEDQEISALRAKIAAYEGDTVFIDRWLSAQKTVDIKNYKDMFFLAQDRKQTDTAMFVAEKMHADLQSDESRDLLVNALLAAKRYEAALPYLRDLKTYSEQDKNNYLSVLMELAAKNPKYNQELAQFAASQLHGNVPASQKQALIYALLNANRADLALPYIKEFARTQGGEWVEIYADNLDRLGHSEEAREFRLQIAADPESSPKTRRDIGYKLLDKGYKNDAMVVFSGLAVDAPADSPDVQQLLYLWGPRLTSEQLDWITQRALNSSQAEDRRQWIEYVSGHADAEELVALIDRNPDMVEDPVLLDGYLNALQRLDQLEAMKDRIANLSEKTNNPALLRAYARATQGYSMTRLSQATYKKLNQATGGDSEAKRNLGLIAFNQADYSDAKKYLQNYVKFRKGSGRYHKDDYQAYFYLAESYRRDREMKRAEPYYRKSLQLLSQIEGKRTADMEARAAQSMVALGEKDSGYKIFDDAMKQYPEDTLLRADYISTLIEQKDYAKAEQLIRGARLDGQAQEMQDVSPLVIPAAIEGYRTFSNDSEMLLEFEGEQETQGVNLNPEELKNYPWLSYTTQGYDRALLVAKPNYKLKLEPTSGGYMVVPLADMESGSQTASFQKDLALRYKMLEARIGLETGKHYQAAEEVTALVPQDPDNGTLLGYAANAENFVGRWKSALNLLDRAQEVMPENEDVEQLRREIRRRHSSHAMLDYEWFRLGDSHQNIWTASGMVLANDDWEAGGNIQINDLEAEGIRRVDGRFGDFDRTVERGELYVAKENKEGTRMQASLFANNDFAGAGVYYSWYHELGRTEAYGEYHRPNWDFIEGVIDSAVRDRIGLTHYYQINPQWAVMGGVALNRYHVDEKSNVADTISIAGTVTRALKEVNPYLALNYALDAEYRLDNEKRIDVFGTSFKPLMDSREVHTVSVIAAENLTEETEGLIQAGYSFDRMNDNHGPILATELNHNMFNDQLEAQLRASYGTFTTEDTGDATRLGGHLKWRF